MSDRSAPGIGVMLGSAVEFTALGKKWQVGPPNQAAKERLEKLAAKVALDEVRRLKDTLDPAAYQEAFGEVTRTLKDYRTWRLGWQRVVFDPEYFHFFFWTLLQEKHPDIGEAEVIRLLEEAPEEAGAALAQVLPDFFRLLLADLDKRLTPEAKAKAEAALVMLGTKLAPQVAPTPHIST